MPSSASSSTKNLSVGVLSSTLDAVGQSPLIHLERLQKAEGLRCRLIGKPDFMSIGGSTKDRIAKAMVLRAEEEGVLIPGQSVVIEPTSGNTGVGLAMACALKGYRCIITMPEKMSLEKEVTLRALGAEIVRTPTEKAWDEEGSHIGQLIELSTIDIANKLEAAIPGGVILNQYRNPANPLAHYLTTWPEIHHSLATSDLDNKRVDVFVAGAGTGGTVMGCSRGMREAQAGESEEEEAAWRRGDRGVVVGVDPEGSILATNGVGEIGGYEVEGIGYDFIPEVLDPKSPLIHHWVKSNDTASFEYARKAHRLEGLLVGGSAGSALSSACAWLKDERPYPVGGWERFGSKDNVNVVVLLADGIRNYMSKPWFLARDASSPLAVEIERVLKAAPVKADQKTSTDEPLPSPPDSAAGGETRELPADEESQ